MHLFQTILKLHELRMTRQEFLHRQGLRTPRLHAVLLVVTFWLTMSWVQAAEVRKEIQVKCSYLHNFTKFVEWPAETFDSDTSPLVIGVYGNEGMRLELETQVNGRTLGKRRFEVKRVETPKDVARVHLLYISEAPDTICLSLVSAAAQEAKLTVGDTDEFVKGGGMIRFVLEEGKIRFEINQGTAEAAKLKLSPQLLKLARVVRKK